MRRFFLVLAVVTLLVLAVTGAAFAGNGNFRNDTCLQNRNGNIVCNTNTNCFNKHGKLKKKCKNDRNNHQCFTDQNGFRRCF